MNTGSAVTKRKKHVFLFRHCVRSTDSRVYLFNNTLLNDNNNNNNNDGNIDVSIPVINFWSRLAQPEVILPNWNVPKNWCTENGIKQMQQTGAYLYNMLLSSQNGESGNNGRKFKFRFISDTSQRDVDTTFALQEGIASAILADTVNMNLYMDRHPKEDDNVSSSTISLASTNVHSAEYIPNLFQPFTSTTMSPTPMCTLQVTKQQMLDEVQHRLSTIVPKPPSNIYNTLKLLQIDGLNMMDVDSVNNVTITTTNIGDKPQLRGMVNFLKLVAQLIFYSRASGIVPRQFLYRITTSQLYTILLPYIYYTRSILDVGTTEAATRGAILTRTMIDAIQFFDNPNDDVNNNDDDNNNDNVDTVTILVGHDTDLDAVATAMNVAWEFDLPYNTNNFINSSSFLLWYMTPPGSAIYLSHESNVIIDGNRNEEDTKVNMSYLHPIYNIDKNDGSITSYDMVPLQLMNYSNDGNSNHQHVYQTNNDSVTIQFHELQRHINVTLQQYIGATDCYYNTIPVSGRQQHDTTTGNNNNNSNKNTNSSTGSNSDHSNSGSVPTVDSIDSIKSPTMPPSGGDGSKITPKSTINDEQLSKSWGSGFGSGVAVSILFVLLFWYYTYRKQRRMRSQYSQPHHHPSNAMSSLQLNEYSDADDADTVATSNRGQKKRNVDII